MRSESQVFDQLLSFARCHDEIRAVVMNGSRANPNSPQDIFRDYDIVYYVTNPRQFLDDQTWISTFGELVILQQNDFNDHGTPGYIFLMLFTDGVRIDLAFDALAELAYLGEDSMTVVLLDKDNRIPPLPPASDAGYLIKKPSRKEFAEATNEIFWCSNNIAKGLWRDELPYAKEMFEVIVRPCIKKLLAWYAAEQHGWRIDTGYMGKWLKKYLPADIWEVYVRTYAGADPHEIWDSLFTALQLSRQVGMAVAQALGYDYPLQDDQRMLEYLRWVRAMPGK